MHKESVAVSTRSQGGLRIVKLASFVHFVAALARNWTWDEGKLQMITPSIEITIQGEENIQSYSLWGPTNENQREKKRKMEGFQ